MQTSKLSGRDQTGARPRPNRRKGRDQTGAKGATKPAQDRDQTGANLRPKPVENFPARRRDQTGANREVLAENASWRIGATKPAQVADRYPCLAL